MLKRLGVEYFEIRQYRDLEQEFDGLILPGGESTVMGKLLEEEGLMEPLRTKIAAGTPVFGTCAGLILLAAEVAEDRTYLGTMAVRVKRNAYGRQLGSFQATEKFEGIGDIPMTFIRAPYIEEVTAAKTGKEEVRILAKADGKIVAARQGNQLAAAFHPELTEDLRVHRYFIEMVKTASGQ